MIQKTPKYGVFRDSKSAKKRVQNSPKRPNLTPPLFLPFFRFLVLSTYTPKIIFFGVIFFWAIFGGPQNDPFWPFWPVFDPPGPSKSDNIRPENSTSRVPPGQSANMGLFWVQKGPFRAVLGHFGPKRVILGCFWPFFGPFWTLFWAPFWTSRPDVPLLARVPEYDPKWPDLGVKKEGNNVKNSLFGGFGPDRSFRGFWDPPGTPQIGSFWGGFGTSFWALFLGPNHGTQTPSITPPIIESISIGWVLPQNRASEVVQKGVIFGVPGDPPNRVISGFWAVFGVLGCFRGFRGFRGPTPPPDRGPNLQIGPQNPDLRLSQLKVTFLGQNWPKVTNSDNWWFWWFVISLFIVQR